MIDTRVVGQELQDKILEQVRKGQEQVRKGQEAVAEAIRSWTATAQSIAPQLPGMPTWTAPAWTARLPKPEDLVANAQEFAVQLLAAQRKSSEQLIAAQRKFAEEALDAVKPLLALASAAPVRAGDKPTGSAAQAGSGTQAGSAAQAGSAKNGAAAKSASRASASARKPGTTKKASAAK
jgi:hypothetical protein